MEKKRAVGLVSGGLDSILALQIIKEMGFEIIGIYILTPFISNFGEKSIRNLKKLSGEIGFKFEVIECGQDYIKIVRNPEFGYGKNLNPCIDCHIYMLKKAKEIMEREKAEFVFTGEVLGQRGKSQNYNALKIVEEKSSLKGKLVRPLSALCLPQTEVEKEGIVDRNKLLGIKGKERKIQLYLAQMKNLKYFGSPAGGCLLTDPQFCKRLKDLFEYEKEIKLNHCYLLQIGRHFRISPSTKLIISRNEKEKEKMSFLMDETHYLIETSPHYGPSGIICGKISPMCFEIFSAYSYENSSLLVKTKNGEVIEVRKVKKESKEKFVEFLI